jgi:putative drug exporter of the RND superfamily
MNSKFCMLGKWVATHSHRVLLGWIVVIAFGGWGACHLPEAVVGGAGGIQGSPSKAVSDTLRAEFTNPFIDPMAVAVSALRLRVEDGPYLAWVAHAASVLGSLPEVRKVSSYADSREERLRSADDHVTMLLVGLSATDNEGQQRGVTAVRDALGPLRAALLRLDPTAQIAVTGGAASDFDLNELSGAGGDHAEKRALPLTLAILAIAFGTLISASLPFLVGLATTTVALGAAFLLAEVVSVSNLLSNVVTMVGLAVGIDYSLLMVTHFRKELPRATITETVAATVAQAGRTISWSGATVIVGFLGLLFSPILETRCAGIGGALVVCISVLAALTLLPALLVVLSPYLDRWPVFPQRFRTAGTERVWRSLGAWIVRRPLPIFIAGSACVLVVALPILGAHTGVTNERWFLPKVSESRIGADILTGLRNDNDSIPIFAIVTSTDGQPLLALSHIRPLFAYAEQLRRDPRVASVASPFTLRKELGADAYASLYQNLNIALYEHPEVRELFLSRDGRSALFEIIPANNLASKSIERLTRDLAAIRPAGHFTVAIGGSTAEDNDFNDYMYKSLPRIFIFVVGATVVILFCAFRSYLLPLKAVLTNLLAVAAGIGAVVAIFQFGWLNGLVGLERPFTAIPLEVPMMIFCLSFGLSMDYELFLLFQIQREYRLDHNNDRAVVMGLSAVAPVITGAGLIMAAVFGAFATADLPVLKMMGVGLCVSIVMDATVIRAFVVPALIAMVGRWNWYPGNDAISGDVRSKP